MLKVKWFDSVNAEIEQALAHLPDPEFCPHEVYLRLLQLPQDLPMRIALISENGMPVAAPGMIMSGRLVCEPVTNRLFVGQGVPGHHNRIVDAYVAMGRDVRVLWFGESPPTGWCVHDADIVKSYCLSGIAKREEFWRETGYWRTIRKMRDRTARFEVCIGDPRWAAPIAAGWRRRWADKGPDDFGVRARALLADALEPMGRHITIALLHDGELAAGALVHQCRDGFLGHVLHVPETYRAVGAGIRLFDLVFQEAEARGVDKVDLGPGGEYKARWAPLVDNALGRQAGFCVITPMLKIARDAVWATKKLTQQVRSLRANIAGVIAWLGGRFCTDPTTADMAAMMVVV